MIFLFVVIPQLLMNSCKIVILWDLVVHTDASSSMMPGGGGEGEDVGGGFTRASRLIELLI